MPRAIGRSKRPDSFGRSAGARFTVIRLRGNSKPAFCSAARTRSRASLTSVSGSPTTVTLGRPPARCTSTATSGAARPSSPRLCTMARGISISQSAGDHRRRCAPASAAQAGWSGGFSSRSRRASSAFSFSLVRWRTCVWMSNSSRLTRSSLASPLESNARAFFSISAAGLAAMRALKRAPRSSRNFGSSMVITEWRKWLQGDSSVAQANCTADVAPKRGITPGSCAIAVRHPLPGATSKKHCSDLSKQIIMARNLL
jgi:hypothetical protein